MNIRSLWCRIIGHKFRRAKKGQPAGFKYCRCGATRAVKTRKQKVVLP